MTRSAVRAILGARELGESLEDRFCRECGTLLTHNGAVWACANCNREGLTVSLSPSPSPFGCRL